MATAVAPVPASPAAVSASLARWENILGQYRARGMRSYAKRAERTVAELRRVAERAAPAAPPAPRCAWCSQPVLSDQAAVEIGAPGEWMHDGAGLGPDCRGEFEAWAYEPTESELYDAEAE